MPSAYFPEGERTLYVPLRVCKGHAASRLLAPFSRSQTLTNTPLHIIFSCPLRKIKKGKAVFFSLAFVSHIFVLSRFFYFDITTRFPGLLSRLISFCSHIFSGCPSCIVIVMPKVPYSFVRRISRIFSAMQFTISSAFSIIGHPLAF